MSRKKRKQVPLIGYKIDKSDLVNFVQVRSGLRKADATKIVESLLGYIKEIILHGYIFTIPEVCDIGVSMTEHRPSRPCINPKTLEHIMSKEKFPEPYLNIVPTRIIKRQLLDMAEEGVMKFESYIDEYMDDDCGE